MILEWITELISNGLEIKLGKLIKSADMTERE